MRAHTDSLDRLLRSGANKRFVADLYYNNVRRMEDVPLESPKFRWDANGAIEGSGSCTVVFTDEFATSVAPKLIGDVLAPFGAELAVYVIVTAGRFSERVPIGWYRITDVPSALDETMSFRDRVITVGSTVELELQDRSVTVRRDEFDAPSSPASLDSVWDEVGRLTGLQLTRTIADKPITRSVVYQEDKWDAVYDLLDILDASPHITPDGTLAARPKTLGAPVDYLSDGQNGTIVSIGQSLSPDQVYNKVIVTGDETVDGKPIIATAEIRSGPLRTLNADGTRSPYHRVTTRYYSKFFTTQAQAQAEADTRLLRVSRLAAVKVPIVETFNPLRELGDVITFDRDGETVIGQVTGIDLDDSETTGVELEVAGG